MNLKTLILSGFIVVGTAFAGSCQDILSQNAVKDFIDKTSNDVFFLKEMECRKDELSLEYIIDDKFLYYDSEKQKDLVENARCGLFHAYCDKDGVLKDFRNNGFSIYWHYADSKNGGFGARYDENLCQRIKHGSN